MAISPRTIWASLSPLKLRRGAAPGDGALDLSREPDLTGAAANFVRLRSRSFRQWRQGAAELDHVAIAVLPVIQEPEVREDVLERHGSSSATGDTTSTAPASAPVPISLSPGLGEKYSHIRRARITRSGRK